MTGPYFLHYVNEVDFARIAEHDVPLLESYAAGVDLSHEKKFGPAARALWGGKAGLPRVYEWMREWEQLSTEEGVRKTLQAFLALGAEARLPVPFHLKLFEEEAFAHRYFWETHEIFVPPVTVALIVLRAVPFEGVATTPAGARVAALLMELLKGGVSLTTAYTALLDSFRDAQTELRRVTAAYAEGTPLAEPVVAQALTPLQVAVSTNGLECQAQDFTSFTLAAAALYDLWWEVSEGLSLRKCAWKECGRIFIPKDGRHRCHSALCMRRLKKEEKTQK